jgi:hypothetical protein
MRLGGIYTMEPLNDFHWVFMTIGAVRLYHYLVLQPLSLLTEVNLNNMMCPAISDPFKGPYFRIAANVHQTFFYILHGKLYCLIGSRFFVPKLSTNQQKKDEETKMSINNINNESMTKIKQTMNSCCVSKCDKNNNKLINGKKNE